jgi:sodium-dependent dicarboxylate transporter 2/3/5
MNTEGFTKYIGIIIAIVVFFLLWSLLPPDLEADAKLSIALVAGAVILWVTEAITFGQTSFLVILVIGFTSLVPLDLAFSGFASGAMFLIIAGMMMARAVNATPLAQRMTYYILLKFGTSTSKVLAGILLISQIQAFFVPATAVRASLLMPVVIALLKTFDYKSHPNIRRQFMLGVAYGGNISGTAILPAAIGNVLTVEILNIYLDYGFSYFDWFLVAFPIWFLLIPAIWFILIRTCPAEVDEIAGIKETIQLKLSELGKITPEEKRCLGVLGVTVLMWMTESLHHMHPAIPAIFATIALTLPRIGVTSWENILHINLDTILVLGVTLSLGNVLNETGAIEWLGGFLQAKWLVNSLEQPLLAVALIAVITQIYHLGVSNVGTAVVTLLPVLIGVTVQAGIEPIFIVITSAITCLFGFILVVETMPNVIVQGSGYITQREFIIPGIWATIASTIITIIVAATWWGWIGFLP